MTSIPGPRWFATPLDASAALTRARQLSALADPDRLRVLSGIASRPDGVASAQVLATDLEIERAEVEAHLQVLIELGLITAVADLPGQFAPTADTWMRFSRLVARAQVNADVDASVPATRPASSADARWPSDAVDPTGSVGLGADRGGVLPPVVQRIADRLAYRFSSTFSQRTVERYVADSYRLLSERARVAQHLPSLASRFAEDRLGALAVANGRDLTGTPEVLFVCVQNAGRSQMAAAMLRQMAGAQVHVRTAGSRPSGRVDPVVIEVLDEIGVPVTAEFPKPLTDEVVQAADFVITMGCGDACPIYSGRRYMDWPVADPVGRPIADVRAIRDEIVDRLRLLCREMAVDVPERL